MARRRPRTGSLRSVMSNLPGTSDPLNDRIDSLVENRRRVKEEAALKYGGGFGGRILYGMAESVFGERVASKINTASRDRSQLYNPSEQMTRGQGGSAVREIKPILEKINNKVDYLASKIDKIDARLGTKNITIGKGDKQQTFRYDPLAPEGKQVTAATASGRSGRFASKAESASVLSKAAYLGNQEYQMPQTSTRVSQNDAKQIIEQLKKDLTKSGGRETQSQIAAAEDRKDYAAGEKDERNQEYQEDVIKKLDEILEKIEDGGGALESLLGGAAGAAGAAGLARLLPMLAPLLTNPYVLGAIGITAVLFASYQGIERALEGGKFDKKQTAEPGRTEGGKETSVDVVEAGTQYIPPMGSPFAPAGLGFGTSIPDKFELPKDETTVVETYYDGDELIGYLSTDGKLYVASGRKEEVLERYKKGDATSVTVASGKMPDIPRQETTGASSSSPPTETLIHARSNEREIAAGTYRPPPEELSSGESRELDEDFNSLPPSETPAAPTPKPAPKSDPTQPLINAAINAMSGSPFAKTKQPKEIPTTDNGKKSTSDQEALDARVNAADEILKYEELAREVAEINDQSVMFADGTTLKFDSQSRSAYGIIGEDNSLGARDLENRLINAIEVRDGKEARANEYGDRARSFKVDYLYQFLMAKYYKDGLIVPPVDATLYDQNGNVIKVIKGKKSLGLTDKTYDSYQDKDMYELMDPEYRENQYKPEYVMPGTVGADKPTYMFDTPRQSSIDEGVRVKEFEGDRVVPLSETAKLEIEETNRIRKEAGLPPVYDLAEHERRLEIQRKGDAIARGMAQDANIPLPPMLPLDKTNEALREAQTQLEMSEEENKTALETASPVINNIDSRTINNVAPSSAPPPPMTVNSRNDETSYGDIAARIFSHPAKHPVA